MNTQELLQERGKTHGDFSDNAKLSQDLKFIIASTASYPRLNDIEREALSMICHKLARIGCGNPHFKDHWDDIAGYAKLVSDRL